jgi:SprT protein
LIGADMTREDIIARVHFYISEANKIWNIHSPAIPMPSVDFYSKGSHAGSAGLSSHSLSFNEVLASENSDSFENTIIHEVAHLVTHRLYPRAKQKHGPEFKEVCQTLGGDGKTYHTYNTESVAIKRTKTRYIYLCRNPECRVHYELTPQKHKVSDKYCCSKCGYRLQFTGDIRKFK